MTFPEGIAIFAQGTLVSGYLLDTNVLSEFRKRTKADAKVLAWFASVTTEELFLSVLVLGEIRRGIRGIERARPKTAAKRVLWNAGWRVCNSFIRIEYCRSLTESRTNGAD